MDCGLVGRAKVVAFIAGIHRVIDLISHPPCHWYAGSISKSSAYACTVWCLARPSPSKPTTDVNEPITILSCGCTRARAQAAYLWITQMPFYFRCILCPMSKPPYELATARARLYPTTYKKIVKLARERRTTIAQIIAELAAKV
jgi:hypothetical protein